MRKIHMALAFVLFFGSFSLHADQSEIERDNLSKLELEIDYLMQRVEKIKYNKNDHSRLKFDYNALLQDLVLVKSGIKDYMSKSLNNGRVIKSINGHYR